VAAVLFVAFGISTTVAQESPIEALKSEIPKWNTKLSVKADLSCRGVGDTVVVGTSKDFVWIGIVYGQKDGDAPIKPYINFFPVTAGEQGALCAMPVRIQTSDHDCNNESGELPDCQPVKGCKDFSVIDDTCDPLNFYWNTKYRAMSWWRN